MVDEDEHTPNENNTDNTGDSDIEPELPENEDKPAFNSVVEPEPEKVTRRPIGRGFVLSGFVLSALLGGGLGVVGSKILSSPDKTADLRVELMQEIEGIKTDFQEQSKTQVKKLGSTTSAQKKTKSRLAAVERTNKSLTKQVKNLEQDLMELQEKLNQQSEGGSIAARLESLEKAQNLIAGSAGEAENIDGVLTDGLEKTAVPDMARVSEASTDGASKDGASTDSASTDSASADGTSVGEADTNSDVTALTVDTSADASTKKSGEESAEDITAALETSASDLDAEASVDVAAEDAPQDIQASTEQEPQESTAIEEQEQDPLEILIDTFPRAKMLAAVKVQEKLSSEKPGWLKRTLSKHIRVGNDDAPDPYAIIDAAQAALKSGHVSDAVNQISKLNPPVRTSAAEWVQAAKKAAHTIEQDN